MNISDISQRYIGIYLIKGRKNMHHEMSNSTTKESVGEEIKYRANHLNSGIGRYLVKTILKYQTKIMKFFIVYNTY